MAKRNEVFEIINDERTYQDRKWGTIYEHPHEVGSWITVMRKLLRDAEDSYQSSRGDIGALNEIRKLVAVGVACMEQHGAVGRSQIDFSEQRNFTTLNEEVNNGIRK